MNCHCSIENFLIKIFLRILNTKGLFSTVLIKTVHYVLAHFTENYLAFRTSEIYFIF